MTWNPIDFKDLPNETTPIDALNLNYIQQGIVIAIDHSSDVYQAWQDGSLNGTNGKNGEDGENGDIGPVGPAGRSFEIDGFAETLADLPTPTMALQNKIWVSYEFGHLHFCDGVEWIDWGQFVGVQGERGPIGPKGEDGKDGIFDIETLTDEDIQALHTRLTPLNNDQVYKYFVDLQPSKTAKVPIADLNLYLSFTRGTGVLISYRLEPINTAEPATYYANRLSNYDLTAWESSVTSGYTAQVIPASGFVLDASGYLPGREHTDIEIIDPGTNKWYSIRTIGMNDGSIFIDVTKKAVHDRQIIPTI